MLLILLGGVIAGLGGFNAQELIVKGEIFQIQNTVICYIGKVYRPPSEADAYILNATIGGSWNKCTYCDR